MRVNEQGRSMIEMLGVLAIVGVLSVGGIAGYSKAMNKFKTNKVIDQVNMISTNIRTLYSSQRSYEGLDNALAIKTGVVPSEMYEAASGDVSEIINAFSGTVYITTGTHNGQAHAAYIIGFDGLPRASCVTAATTDWGGDVGSGFAAMYVDGELGARKGKEAALALSADSTEITPSANYAVPGDEEYGTPVSVITAQAVCVSDTDNAFALKYI